MSMPPQGAFLPDDVELVGEILVWLDRELRDHRNPVCPTVKHLLHSMPTPDNTEEEGLQMLKYK
jgi:hypothetical protein